MSLSDKSCTTYTSNHRTESDKIPS